MYQLTLTYNERQAISFIGNRYWTGDDLYKMLWVESSIVEPENGIIECWDSHCDITFNIPEHIVQNMFDMYIQNNMPCLSKELWEKFMDIIIKIV